MGSHKIYLDDINYIVINKFTAAIFFVFVCFVFSTFFIGKKTLMYSPCPSVCESIFSRTMRHTEPKFLASLRLYYMLDTIQIWFISDNGFGSNLKKNAKTEPHKAYETMYSLYSISI